MISRAAPGWAAFLRGPARQAAAAGLALLAVLLAACGSDGAARPTATNVPFGAGATAGGATAVVGPTAMPETTGVSDGQVVFGQSAAFSGPAQELGINMRLGIEAAFAEANLQVTTFSSFEGQLTIVLTRSKVRLLAGSLFLSKAYARH